MKNFKFGTPQGQIIDQVKQAAERGDDLIVLSRPKGASADTPHQAWATGQERDVESFLRSAVPELAD